ncbi:hypothetical protein Trydic_g4936, partial [Trypoxylus dichotomus]
SATGSGTALLRWVCTREDRFQQIRAGEKHVLTGMEQVLTGMQQVSSFSESTSITAAWHQTCDGLCRPSEGIPTINVRTVEQLSQQIRGR